MKILINIGQIVHPDTTNAQQTLAHARKLKPSGMACVVSFATHQLRKISFTVTDRLLLTYIQCIETFFYLVLITH